MIIIFHRFPSLAVLGRLFESITATLNSEQDLEKVMNFINRLFLTRIKLRDLFFNYSASGFK